MENFGIDSQIAEICRDAREWGIIMVNGLPHPILTRHGFKRIEVFVKRVFPFASQKEINSRIAKIKASPDIFWDVFLNGKFLKKA